MTVGKKIYLCVSRVAGKKEDKQKYDGMNYKREVERKEEEKKR